IARVIANSLPRQFTRSGEFLIFTAQRADGTDDLWKVTGDNANGFTLHRLDSFAAEPGQQWRPQTLLGTNTGMVYVSILEPSGSFPVVAVDPLVDASWQVKQRLGAFVKIEALVEESNGLETFADNTLGPVWETWVQIDSPQGSLTTEDAWFHVYEAGQFRSYTLTDVVRELLATGRNRLALKLSIPSNVHLDLIASVDSENPAVSMDVTTETIGVAIDVFDHAGRLIAENQSAVDMRSMDAGTYYARIHRDSTEAFVTQDSALPFTIAFDAPFAGQSRPVYDQTDRDLIRGGDGNDLLIGNEDLDQLFGDSGSDTFVVSYNTLSLLPADQTQTEVRDWNAGEDRFIIAAAANETGAILSFDINPVVEIPDVALRLAIAQELGLTASTNDYQLLRPLRASDLARLSHLDVTHDRGVKTLFAENFDGYLNGSDLGGQGGWIAEDGRVIIDQGKVASAADSNSVVAQVRQPLDLRALAASTSGIITLSFDVQATTTSGNSSVRIGDFGWRNNNNTGWDFLRVGPTATFVGGIGPVVRLAVVIDLGNSQIYGTYDFADGLGIRETPRYELTSSILATFTDVEIYQDRRTNLTNRGPMLIDNIVVTLDDRIRDLTGLEFAPNLETLVLSGNSVSDLGPLTPGRFTGDEFDDGLIGLTI
ncbi:MAG: hypothetical protein KDB00_26585, partial [Planctomycetales bacterium]|nr:hypothetical protein [Planctomycetales bacterium]